MRVAKNSAADSIRRIRIWQRTPPIEPQAMGHAPRQVLRVMRGDDQREPALHQPFEQAFHRGALPRIEAAPEVIEVVTTNTVPIPEKLLGGKLTVISLAPALAEAIRRIHEGESVSVLFAQ